MMYLPIPRCPASSALVLSSCIVCVWWDLTAPGQLLSQDQGSRESWVAEELAQPSQIPVSLVVFSMLKTFTKACVCIGKSIIAQIPSCSSQLKMSSHKTFLVILIWEHAFMCLRQRQFLWFHGRMWSSFLLIFHMACSIRILHCQDIYFQDNNGFLHEIA